MSVGVFEVGHSVSIDIEITEEWIDRFAALSGDDNQLHMDANAAREAGFANRVAHGVLLLTQLSTVIGTRLPGPGALWRSLQWNWSRPVFPQDRITVEARVKQWSDSSESIVLSVRAPSRRGCGTGTAAPGGWRSEARTFWTMRQCRRSW